MAIQATYLSANSFSVANDQTTLFTEYRQARFTISGTGTYLYGTISGSSYTPITTAVTLYDSVLLPTISGVEYGIVSASGIGSLPDHTHTASQGDGGEITLDKYTQAEVDTISGSLQTDIDTKADSSHTVLSHDTDTTGAELTSLADNSMADTLHRHSELSASDGSPDKIVYTDSDGVLYADAGPLGLDVQYMANIGTHLDVVNNITVGGTVDGVDIAARDHAESHSVASHNDTTATGAELDELTDGSDTTLHIHDNSYYTETEVDAAFVTFSGTIDHNTIINTHDLTTDIDHDQLTNYEANEHFTEATIDHSAITNLDYASAGHTDFASTEALATTSGVLDDKIVATENAAATTYYLHEDASDLGGYELLKSAPSDHAESFDSVNINSGDGETLIDSYVTVSGEPNTTSIPPGTYVWVLWADVSALSQGPHYLRAKWYRREQDGTEHYLFTQEQQITSTSPTKYFVETSVSGIDTDITDRLVTKTYAQIGGGSNRTVGYYVEGMNRSSRFNTPVLTSLITDHGDLIGLGDDDHTQYFNTDRGDARYYQQSSDILFTTNTISGTGQIITGDHGVATKPEVVNVIYGTGAAPSGAGYPEATIYVQYTA